MSKLWGGRFSKKSDPLADQFSFSIAYDERLAKYDIEGSIAHAQMLGKCKIIPAQDAKKIVAGLKKIYAQVMSGKFKYDAKQEDIHTNIQDVLKKIAGASADKLHTARSRNDQVVLDVRLYCRSEIIKMINGITVLQKTILSFADKNKDVIIPAYTHLQAAQVVLLAHHMLAYIEMLERDKSRLKNAYERVNCMPLGSCALSGTTLPIDRAYVAKQLGFKTMTNNSIDAVSDRDFVLETLSALSLVAMHLSRISEDLILWVTQEFNFIELDMAFCTGSSIMPHKKNPDTLELIRGTTGKIYGHLLNALNLMKALPLTYNRDMQLDKPPLFDSVDTVKQMVELLAKIFATLKVKKDQAKRSIINESFFTVDLMEYMIQHGVSYREAHDIVGKMVKECLDKGNKLSQLTLDQLRKYSPKISGDVKKVFSAQASIAAKKSFGSTNPQMVNAQLRSWKAKLHASFSL
ncbi:MAG TPA: argininosuccinate lyase [Candidatus Omnitrophota bacterium]|nr:argininosuccinate lyase [Candidatus Omnitrophota bacterium]